jgi:hypothetical protein
MPLAGIQNRVIGRGGALNRLPAGGSRRCRSSQAAGHVPLIVLTVPFFLSRI